LRGGGAARRRGAILYTITLKASLTTSFSKQKEVEATIRRRLSLKEPRGDRNVRRSRAPRDRRATNNKARREATDVPLGATFEPNVLKSFKVWTDEAQS
jgi:hypothetical protein